MKLHEAFQIVRGDVVAFIGAGGKTSALIGLGYELVESGWRVLATTSTSIAEDQLALMPRAMTPQMGGDAISDALTEDGFVFLYDRISNGRVYGPGTEWIPRLMDAVDSDIMLVEADQAEGLPLKAPFSGEPIIPPDTSLVVPVASLSVIGQPLDADHVYNPQAMIDRYGFAQGNPIRSPWIAQVIRDEALGLQGVPDDARLIAYLNQAPHKGYGRIRARRAAKLALRHSKLDGVAVGSVRGTEPVYEVHRPIGAIVLAAGLSSRMGEPKVLLPWEKDKTIIEHIIEQLIRSRIEHIVVVTGHMAREVKEIIKPYGVKVTHNRSYKTGEMLSSVKAGLRALPDQTAAAMVVLGDQPRLQPWVIYQVLMAYAQSNNELIIPSFQMRRGHPILIGRRYWPEILNLPRSGALREVIKTHEDQIHYVDVNTDSILRDVDTPEDYSNERRLAGLT